MIGCSVVCVCVVFHRRVQSLLGMIALRRVKTQIVDGKPLIELPTRDVFVETVTLSAEEREIYDVMQNEGKLIVNKSVLFQSQLHQAILHQMIILRHSHMTADWLEHGYGSQLVRAIGSLVANWLEQLDHWWPIG